MPPKTPTYQTKELSMSTWSDLEKLFTKPGIGDAWWCWCTFHHTASFSKSDGPRSRAEWAAKNRQKKEDLVERDQSHGILVHAPNSEVVGWCQYGPSEELPRMDHNRNYRRLGLGTKAQKLWRITCFVVDKEYRRQGVATAALNGAIDSIRKRGGGVVEAFPVRSTDQGPGYMCTGRVSTFEKAGFKIVGPLATGRTATVAMRRTV